MRFRLEEGSDGFQRIELVPGVGQSFKELHRPPLQWAGTNGRGARLRAISSENIHPEYHQRSNDVSVASGKEQVF